MRWYKKAKFITSKSVMCGHCMSPLYPIDIKINYRHHFPIGQQWSCQCGKSEIWTNSIRDPEYFLDFLDGKNEKYYQGICNDKFCGLCYKIIYPLQNGYEIPGQLQRMDRFGCASCKGNQMILMDGFKELKENETGPILEWYKNNSVKLKNLAGKENDIQL